MRTRIAIAAVLAVVAFSASCGMIRRRQPNQHQSLRQSPRPRHQSSHWPTWRSRGHRGSLMIQSWRSAPRSNWLWMRSTATARRMTSLPMHHGN